MLKGEREREREREETRKDQKAFNCRKVGNYVKIFYTFAEP